MSAIESEDQSKCLVCADKAEGMNYGALTCLSCKGFFCYSMKLKYELKCKANENCVINKNNRKKCRYCRFQKCVEMGMKGAEGQRGRKSIIATCAAGINIQKVTDRLAQKAIIKSDQVQASISVPLASTSQRTENIQACGQPAQQLTTSFEVVPQDFNINIPPVNQNSDLNVSEEILKHKGAIQNVDTLDLSHFFSGYYDLNYVDQTEPFNNIVSLPINISANDWLMDTFVKTIAEAQTRTCRDTKEIIGHKIRRAKEKNQILYFKNKLNIDLWMESAIWISNEVNQIALFGRNIPGFLFLRNECQFGLLQANSFEVCFIRMTRYFDMSCRSVLMGEELITRNEILQRGFILTI